MLKPQDLFLIYIPLGSEQEKRQLQYREDFDDLRVKPCERVNGGQRGGKETVWQHLRDHRKEQHFSSDLGLLQMAATPQD